MVGNTVAHAQPLSQISGGKRFDAFSRGDKEFVLYLMVHSLTRRVEQEQYDQILAYLRTGNMPIHLSKNAKDSLRRKSKSFIAKDGMLFYKDKIESEYQVIYN